MSKMRALILTLFATCFATKEMFDKYYLNIDSDVTSEVDVPIADPKGYTVSLEENEEGAGASHAACMKYRGVSAVNEILENVLLGVFLRYALNDASLGVIGRNDVGGDLPFLLSAQVELTKRLGVSIVLEITNILMAPAKLSTEIGYQTSGVQMYGPTILMEVEKYYKNSLNPDIICVITKLKFYSENLNEQLGFSTSTTLCEKMVPILLTFDWETEDDVPSTAKLLAQLIISSRNYVNWSTFSKKAEYFDGCNIRHRPKGDEDDDPDTYYVLPFDEDQYYG
uniref:Putative lipocalin n=1 Tax=Ixodes ricinus TaxID=34613 RepID=A0A6B0V760_IXORI